MFDFSSLMPQAALSAVATLADRTPDHFYNAHDAFPITPFHTHKDSQVVACLLAYNSLRDLENGDEAHFSYKGITQKDTPIGDWNVWIARHDFKEHRFQIPRELDRLSGEKLIDALSEGINSFTKAVVVHRSHPLLAFEKIVQGKKTSNLSVGLIHACCSAKENESAVPDVGFFTNGYIHAAIAGETPIARIDFILNRVA